MVKGSVTVLATRRGSAFGPDGRFYPSTEEPAVPLSGAAIRLILYLYAALRRLLYPRHEMVYVAADQFIYYAPHDRTRKIAPDIWVCYGVPKQPERDVFRTWEEEATPSFVAEISSRESRNEDRGHKFSLYEDVLRCREYLLYDEELDELLLYRRQGDALRPVPPDEDGRVHSEELDVSFGRDPETLVRVYGPDRQPVLDMEEVYEYAKQAEVEARLRRHFEERAAALAAEVERLKAELARALQERGQ
jgi:Uma2 family endonuclease